MSVWVLTFNDGLSPSQFDIVMPSFAQVQIAGGIRWGVEQEEQSRPALTARQGESSTVANFKAASFKVLTCLILLVPRRRETDCVGEFVADGAGGITSALKTS